MSNKDPMYVMTPEELLLAQENEDEARKLIELASIQLMRHRPFYGTLIAAMPVQEATSWLNTMATNGRDLFYSVEFVAGMTDKRKGLVFARIDNNPRLSSKEKQKMKEYIDIFYRPKTAREIVFCLEHEIRHIVGEHISRGRGYDKDMFNFAADYYINISLIIEHMKQDSMGPGWFKDGKNTDIKAFKGEFEFLQFLYIDKKYDGWVTEDIYADLMKNGIPKPQGGDKGPKGGDAHTDSDGNMGGDQSDNRAEEEGDDFGQGDVQDAMGTDTTQQPKLTKEQQNANDSIMRRTIESAVKAAGKGAPPEARKFVDEMGSPKINYLKFLRRTLESLVKENVSYRRLSRRSHSLTRSLRQGGLLTSRQSVGLPAAMKAKTIRVHTFFDVSGSFTDALLRPVRRELRGICNMYDQFEITLAAWSTKLGNIKTYTKRNAKEMEDYRILTTGGTDPRCVFEYLDELKDPADQVLVFTDGEFGDISGVKDWKKKYGKNTIWIILGNQHDWKPPFGRHIIFDKHVN